MGNMVRIGNPGGDDDTIWDDEFGDWWLAWERRNIAGRMNDHGTRVVIAQVNMGGDGDALRVAFFDVSSQTQIYNSDNLSCDCFNYRAWDLCANHDLSRVFVSPHGDGITPSRVYLFNGSGGTCEHVGSVEFRYSISNRKHGSQWQFYSYGVCRRESSIWYKLY